MLLREKPVYGNVRVVEMALSGKFAGDIFKGDNSIEVYFLLSKKQLLE